MEIDDVLLAGLRAVCPAVDVDEAARSAAGRDWWPLSLFWTARRQVAALPGAVARPGDPAQVAALVELCQQAGVPVTASGGRSGVCGASVPVFGGLALDLCGLAGILEVDDRSLLVDVAAGTNGAALEEELRRVHGLTLGHWPQSVALSTVGGWLACRSAGQYSTRYGKIEDMVAGLEVVLADGRVVGTGGQGPRAATGPDLTQCFVGSEGTLGIITRARLRAHPLPPAERRAAWAFTSFEAGLEACRRTLRRGATPAVLRLYDEAESARNFGVQSRALLIALDEGDEALVATTMDLLAACCADPGPAGEPGAEPLDDGLVDQWLESRNDVAALARLTAQGIVVDTIEVAASWSKLAVLYRRAVEGLARLEGTLAASAHQSHAYLDGACLYLTFAGQGPTGDLAWAETYYNRAWEIVMAAALDHGAAISHHHGVGLHRGRWLAPSLGGAFEVLASLKAALDPTGILNPGKLGLPSPWGSPPWP